MRVKRNSEDGAADEIANRWVGAPAAEEAAADAPVETGDEDAPQPAEPPADEAPAPAAAPAGAKLDAELDAQLAAKLDITRLSDFAPGRRDGDGGAAVELEQQPPLPPKKSLRPCAALDTILSAVPGKPRSIVLDTCRAVLVVGDLLILANQSDTPLIALASLGHGKVPVLAIRIGIFLATPP